MGTRSVDTGLSVEYLRSILHYNRRTGIWTWLVRLSRRICIGDVAGTITHGYVIINIDGRHYRAHVLAWLYVKGVWPSREVDHKNTIRSDNRWCNLRLATTSQQNMNNPIRRDNTSGHKGVSWCKRKRKWRIYITINCERIELGYRADYDVACALRDVAQAKYHDVRFVR